MLGKREGSESPGRSLDVVDRRITLWQRPSQSSSSLQAQLWIEYPLQSPGHWVYGGLWCRAVGDWTCARGDGQQRTEIANAQTENRCSRQWLTCHNPMNNTPSDRPGAAISKADKLESAGSPPPWNCNLDSLGPGTLWHPRKWKSRPLGKPRLRRRQTHGYRAAIHLGLRLR